MFKNHPKGLLTAALSNMGERFGYYIMNAVLVLFLCSKFGLSEAASGTIYSFFYAGIYILSLVGGLIADRTQNYKGTIKTGLVVMAIGYIILSVPILATSQNTTWLLTLTCVALFLIAFGNGLFKGNLQAIVGQMYDNFEAEAAKQGPDALKIAKDKRDSGFQIFYVFINVGGLIAPFIAPVLRQWWLGANGLSYNAQLPALCHEYINNAAAMAPDALANLQQLMTAAGGAINDMTASCLQYLQIFNEGIHYSFIASVAAMLISLVIFFVSQKTFPNPAKKATAQSVTYTPEEKAAMAKEITQRMYALFAVLGIVIFFWFSFHQNGLTLTFFAKEYTDLNLFGMPITAELFQSLNPFFVVFLTPVVMAVFARQRARGKEPSTPKKIAIGMGIAATGFIIMAVGSFVSDLPLHQDIVAAGTSPVKVTPLLLMATYLVLTIAELYISPLGISFVSKVAPPKYQGIMQGGWLGATAIGNQLLFIGAVLYESIPIWMTWTVFVVACCISMCTMLFMLKWLERVAK